MAEGGVEVGTGYITIVPSAQGFLGKLQAQVAPQAAAAGDDAGKRMGGGIKGGIGAVAAGAGKLFAPIAGALAAVEIKGFFDDAIDEAREAEKVGKTTEQIIRATGGAAKISAEGVGDLAAAISAKSGMDDEAIQSGANLLLTFKNVKNEVGDGANIFDRATQAAVDLSAAGFGSVEGSSKMLGKALNDPIRGISALGRAGVTFSEDQKKAIEQMVKTGDVLGAQKLIMQEVESQVGGVAEANATAGEKMSVAWGNFKEDIGTRLMPVLDMFAGLVTDKILPGITDLIDGVGSIGKILFEGDYDGKLADLFGWEEDHPLIDFLFNVREGLQELLPRLQEMIGPMDGVATAGDGIMSALQEMWTVIEPILQDVLDKIMGEWINIQPTVEEIFTNAKNTVNDVMIVIQAIIQEVTDKIKWIWDTWGDEILTQIGIFARTFGGVFEGISKVVSGIWQTLAGLLTGDTQKAKDGILKVFDGFGTAFGSIFRGAVDTIGNVWSGIKSAMADPVNWVIGNVLNPLVDNLNGLARTFGVKLNISRFNLLASGGSSSGGGKGKGSMAAMAGGGIFEGFTPFFKGDDMIARVRRGEGVYVSEAMLDPYERWRLYEVNKRALQGKSFKDLQPGHDLAGYAGGGIVANASQGFRGYNPAFLSAIKAWAAATGRQWLMTGNGGARTFADQLRAWNLYQSGRGPLAANPWRGGPHMMPANAMDLSPRPGQIPSARALLGRFGLGLPVRGEPWHVGWAGGGRGGGGGGFSMVDFITDQVSGIIKSFTGPGIMGDIMNALPKWVIGNAAKLFDNGGWMEPGWNFNGLKEAEPVFTPSQWKVLEGNLARGVDKNVYQIDRVEVTIPVDKLEQIQTVQDFFDALQLESLMTGGGDDA